VEEIWAVMATLPEFTVKRVKPEGNRVVQEPDFVHQQVNVEAAGAVRNSHDCTYTNDV
jgi:hypothetical protein